MIRITYDPKQLEGPMQKILLAVKDEAFDVAVDAAAWKSLAKLVGLTPKKWTGLTQKSWQVKKPQAGQRVVFNDSKVMLWLEGGTGNAGTATSKGGYIYPKTKKYLYVPLTQAASYGWSSGMTFGKDYVLAKRVRGIKPMKIVEKFVPEANEILKIEMKNFLAQILT